MVWPSPVTDPLCVSVSLSVEWGGNSIYLADLLKRLNNYIAQDDAYHANGWHRVSALSVRSIAAVLMTGGRSPLTILTARQGSVVTELLHIWRHQSFQLPPGPRLPISLLHVLLLHLYIVLLVVCCFDFPYPFFPAIAELVYLFCALCISDNSKGPSLTVVLVKLPLVSSNSFSRHQAPVFSATE